MQPSQYLKTVGVYRAQLYINSGMTSSFRRKRDAKRLHPNYFI